MLSIDAAVVFGVDSLWEERFESRSAADRQIAETIELEGKNGLSNVVEFAGFVYFKDKAVKRLQKISESDVGTNLIHLIQHLKAEGLSVKPFDVTGHWAEFNSPKDIAHFILGTKAETLARLEPLVRQSHIGKQVSFTAAHWENNTSSILAEIAACLAGAKLIVRSSSKGEDSLLFSNAGGFESLLNVDGEDKSAVYDAIEKVIASYGAERSSDDQVLVQEFLCSVRSAGVVFTCGLETGAPYYRFNFDDQTHSTDSVTSGAHSDLRTVIVSRFLPEYLEVVEPELMPVLRAVQEFEQLLGFDKYSALRPLCEKKLVVF